MKINIILITLVLLLCTKVSYGQLTMSKDSAEKIWSTSPAFTIFKDNYFLTGTTLESEPSKYNSDAKFQISFKYRIMNKPLIYGFYPHLTYTQKSYWDIYQNSSPFEESNYNPAMHLIKSMYQNGALNGVLSLSLEHESNGRDSISGSRSWNYLAITYGRILTTNFSASLKMWLPFTLDGNEDLIDYVGYTEADLFWIIKQNQLIADLIVRKGASWNWDGNLQLDVAYLPFKNRNVYFMVQWYFGYAENLIDYYQKKNMLRVGIVLKPTLYKFY